MKTLLIIGAIAENDLSHIGQMKIKNCLDLAEAEQYILREQPVGSVVSTELAAEWIELCENMRGDIPIIVTVAHADPRQMRLWYAYGVSEVLAVGEWQKTLEERFKDSSEPNPIKRKRKPYIPLADDDLEEWMPPTRKPRRVQDHRQTISRTFVVGVAGIMRRTGTTYDAIRLAQTAAAYGKNVACIELLQDERKDVQALATLVSAAAEDTELLGGFRLQGVDYYPNQNLEETVELIGAGYDIVVLDFGSILTMKGSPLHRLEFHRADLSFVTIGGSPWDIQVFSQWQQSLLKRKKPWKLLVHFVDEPGFKQLMEPLSKGTCLKLGLEFSHIPFLPPVTQQLNWKRSIYAQLLQPLIPESSGKLWFTR